MFRRPSDPTRRSRPLPDRRHADARSFGGSGFSGSDEGPGFYLFAWGLHRRIQARPRLSLSEKIYGMRPITSMPPVSPGDELIRRGR